MNASTTTSVTPMSTTDASMTDTILNVEHLSMKFGGLVAIGDLSFQARRGEITALIGPNGAGKTTVLDLICGRTQVSTGSIKFKDQEITGLKEHEIVRRGIGRKFQTPSIYEDLTVFENLELSIPRGRNVAGALFWKRSDAVIERVHEIAKMIFLFDLLERPADILSHGQPTIYFRPLLCADIRGHGSGSIVSILRAGDITTGVRGTGSGTVILTGSAAAGNGTHAEPFLYRGRLTRGATGAAVSVLTPWIDTMSRP